MKLQEWFDEQRKNTPDDMYYKGASGDQIMFVRDRIAGVFAAGLPYEEYKDIVEVVSTHTSKSVKLPVYSMTRADIGLQLVLRGNFYNYKLSVLSEVPLEVDLSGLCHTTPPPDPDYSGDPLHRVYFEGFPSDLIFGYYEPSDKKRFSLELWGGDAPLWMAVFLIMRARGVITPLKWSTR